MRDRSRRPLSLSRCRRQPRMTLYDLLVLLFVAAVAFNGYRQGLVRALVNVAGFAAGLLLALRFEGAAGRALAGSIGSRWTLIVRRTEL